MTYRRGTNNKKFIHKCNEWIIQGVFKSASDWKNAPYGTHAKCISCNIAYPLDSIGKLRCLCCNQALRTKGRSKKDMTGEFNKSSSMLRALLYNKTVARNRSLRSKVKIAEKQLQEAGMSGVIDICTKADRDETIRYLNHKNIQRTRRNRYMKKRIK